MCLFFADQRPKPELFEEQELKIVAFNLLLENLHRFRVLVTNTNFCRYRFIPCEASLPKNSRPLDITLDRRARISTSNPSTSSSMQL